MSTFGSEIDPDFCPDQSCAPKKAAERSGQKLKWSHDGPVLAKNPGPGPGPSLALAKQGPWPLKSQKIKKLIFCGLSGVGGVGQMANLANRPIGKAGFAVF